MFSLYGIYVKICLRLGCVCFKVLWKWKRRGTSEGLEDLHYATSALTRKNYTEHGQRLPNIYRVLYEIAQIC